jgi:hypothetical protein
MQSTSLAPICTEFSDVDLGDARLNRRLVQIAQAAERAPGASLPEQSGSSAALEATYRFLGNDRVSAQSVFDGHVNATLDRAEAASAVFVVHDTTEFRFGGERHREGLGWINSDRRQGFLAHFSFCVSLQGRPLGCLGLFAWARQGHKKGRRTKLIELSDPDRESQRWHEAALLTAERLHNRATAIHLMDREGDSYELFALLLEHEQRFVIRLGHDRRLEPGRGASTTPKLYESLSCSPLFFEREVQLSARRKPEGSNKGQVFPARNRRLARLAVRAEARELFPNHNVAPLLPWPLSLNFVEVRELDPPQDEAPVIWRLVTTEPIDSAEQVAAVIDAYRQRWIIEEFFKALKTGCRYQQLQLDTSRALLVALAIESAIAWQLLLLRWAAHQTPQHPASEVFPEEQLQLLAALVKAETKRSLPKHPTVRDVLLEVARLGGHIKNNGPPGWLILRRGLDKLLWIQRGWILARAGPIDVEM